MPHQLISHLKEGDAVQQYFLVRQVESRTDQRPATLSSPWSWGTRAAP